jgi:hypothetical protein
VPDAPAHYEIKFLTYSTRANSGHTVRLIESRQRIKNVRLGRFAHSVADYAKDIVDAPLQHLITTDRRRGSLQQRRPSSFTLERSGQCVIRVAIDNFFNAFAQFYFVTFECPPEPLQFKRYAEKCK